MDLNAHADTVQLLAAMRQVKAWTRVRFDLARGSAVLVEETSTELPGFPPVQTSVSFWFDPSERFVFNIFKPVADVVEDDLPPRWMKGALLAREEESCSCC